MKKPPLQSDVLLAVFYGGTNGSGKSFLRDKYSEEDTSIELHIDPDRIARKMNPENPRKADLAAGRRALEIFDWAIASNVNFTLESTLTGNGIIKRIQKAVDAGFKTELRYVGLDSPDLNVQRVAQRVAKGGHHIDEEVIRRRYADSRQNLIKAAKIADIVYIWDNSGTTFQLCATVVSGELRIEKGEKLPQWVEVFLKESFPREFEFQTQIGKLESKGLRSSNLSQALDRIEQKKGEEFEP